MKPGLYVSKGTIIQGNITTDANASVTGTINGDIVTKATLVIEKNGLITGNVRAKNAIVKGKINGNVHSAGKVDVIKKGEVGGHVYATEVNVDDESLVKGGTTKTGAANNDGDNEKQNTASENIAPVITNEPAREEEKPQSWF